MSHTALTSYISENKIGKSFILDNSHLNSKHSNFVEVGLYIHINVIM